MSSLAEQDWLAETSSGDVRGFFAHLGVTIPDKPMHEIMIRCFASPDAHRRDDHVPSCSVNMITGLWDCKGCGQHGNAYQAAQLLGMENKAAARLAKQYGVFLELAREKPKLPGERQVKKWRRAMLENEQVLNRLADLKGWTPYAIQRLGVGWDGERIVFPVRNAKYKIVGVARYLPGAEPKMLSLTGSKRDLFPPPESIHRRFPLFLVEGETDAVAVWSVGLRAVGVPGANSWRKEWAFRLMNRKVVMLADCDAPGRALAARIGVDLADARVVDLDPGRDDGYDIGDLVREASNEGGVWQARVLLGGLIG